MWNNINGIWIGRNSGGSGTSVDPIITLSTDIALSFAESNRNDASCSFLLISQDINSDYKNYLINKLLIQI